MKPVLTLQFLWMSYGRMPMEMRRMALTAALDRLMSEVDGRRFRFTSRMDEHGKYLYWQAEIV